MFLFVEEVSTLLPLEKKLKKEENTFRKDYHSL